jgi:hypothetical protein
MIGWAQEIEKWKKESINTREFLEYKVILWLDLTINSIQKFSLFFLLNK